MDRNRLTKIVQTVLAVAILIAVVRLIVILRERHQPGAAARQQKAAERPLNPEAYVVPKKLHAHDLKSAHQLTEQPVWIKEGFRYTYYAYDPRRRRIDFRHEGGELGPIEQLHITDVIAQATPGAPGQRQMMAVFEKDRQSYAVPVGVEKGGDYQIYADEMFFYQDPRQLYDFWPRDIWQAIESRQVKTGMNELQVAFAVGMGIPQPGGRDTRTVQYPNGGNPLLVTYQNGRVTEVQGGSRAATQAR